MWNKNVLNIVLGSSYDLILILQKNCKTPVETVLKGDKANVQCGKGYFRCEKRVGTGSDWLCGGMRWWISPTLWELSDELGKHSSGKECCTLITIAAFLFVEWCGSNETEPLTLPVGFEGGFSEEMTKCWRRRVVFWGKNREMSFKAVIRASEKA